MQRNAPLRKSTLCWLLSLALVFICSSGYSGERDTGTIVPLPAVELKSVLVQWLMTTGYRISDISSKGERESLVVIKGKEERHLTIRPYSALASRLVIDDLPGHGSGQFELDEFLEYVRHNFGDLRETTTEEPIPAAVLSQAGFALAIRLPSPSA